MAYEAESGRKVDRDRFRYWTIYRTVWWALGCLRMAKVWREGEDRMLERVVISRRTSEQELDLLMLLEEEAPEKEQASRAIYYPDTNSFEVGEANSVDLGDAISEWLGTIKHKLDEHDRFQLAVARNALGIKSREFLWTGWDLYFNERAYKLMSRKDNPLTRPNYLKWLRQLVLSKVTVDSPKYPSLAVAVKKWAKKD